MARAAGRPARRRRPSAALARAACGGGALLSAPRLWPLARAAVAPAARGGPPAAGRLRARRRCAGAAPLGAGGAGGARAASGELRALLRLAAPMGLVQLGLVALGLVDTLMVGRISAEALGGVALGNYWKFFWVTFGQGCLVALDGLISRAVGAGDREGVGAGLMGGLVLAVLYSVLLSPLLLLCGPALRALGQPASLVPFASRYSAVQVLSVLPALLFVVLRQTLQATGSMGPLLAAVLMANALNVFLNAALIWGLPGLGIPALGPMGSSWATVWSGWALLLAVAVLGRGALAPLVGPRAGARALRAGPLLRLAALGLPVGVHQVTESLAFAVMMVLVGRHGVVAVAAHHIAMSVAQFTWNVSLGISSAAAVRTGRALGRGDAAGVQRAGVVAIAFTTALMAVPSAAMLLLPHCLASLWTSDARVAAQAAALLPVAGAFQMFDGSQTVASGVLRGLLDTRSAALLALFGYWVVGTPLSVVLGGRLGAAGVWWGMVAGLASTSVLLQLRVADRLRRAGDVPGAELP